MPEAEAEADRLAEILEEGDIRQELASRRGKKADHPDKLQRIFRGRRFAREDMRLLDFEGAEVLLVGARTDSKREYGIEPRMKCQSKPIFSASCTWPRAATR